MENWQTLLERDLQKLAKPTTSHRGETARLVKGERRNVAVLFLDLKDFTSLSETLDHETVHSLVNTVMSALADVVTNYGGYVDKIEGDRIMALFGARRAAENDSIRAVSCGLRMLQTVDELNTILEERGIRLGVRAGISWGPVTVAPDAVDHLTATGDTVNLGSRMEASAPPDSIMVTGEVRSECGDYFSWENLGRISVKGKKEPVDVYKPLGPGEVQKARWERASRLASTSLVGRDTELDLLRNYFHSQVAERPDLNLRGGRRHLVVGLKGEAGVGKSRLVHEFLRGIDRTDALVLKGRARSFAQQPFWLWTSLVSDYLSRTGDDFDSEAALYERVESLVAELDARAVGDALVRSVPFLCSLLAVPSEDPRLSELDERSRHRETVIAVRNFARALGSGHRLAIVLDDLQWMDQPSRQTLSFVLNNCDLQRPILVLCMYRPDWKEEGSPLSEVHQNYAVTEEVLLEPLTEADCERLAVGMLDGPLTEEALRFLVRRSGCNPFFLEELVLDLVECGNLTETPEGWALSGMEEDVYVPSSVDGLIRSRIDRLPLGEREAMQHCSVLGMDFDLALFEELHGGLGLRTDANAVLDYLVERGFLVRPDPAETGDYSFKNALIRHSAYDTLLLHNRRTLHRLAAESMEATYAEDEVERMAPVIAMHWEKTGDVDRAIRWGLRAMHTCRRNYLNEEGLQWSEKVLAMLEDRPREGRWKRDLLETLLGKDDLLKILGRPEERERNLERLLRQAPESELPADHAEVLSRTAQLYRVTGRPKEALEICESALPIARRAGARKTEIYVLNTMGVIRSGLLGESEKARKIMTKALQLAEETGDLLNQITLLGNLGNLTLRLMDHRKAAEYCSRALELAREVGERRMEGILLGNLASLYMEGGKFDEAHEYYLQALEVNRETGNRHGEGIVLGNLGILLKRQEKADEAKECYDRALQLNVETGDLVPQARLQVNLGNLHDSLEEYEEAMSRYEAARDIAASIGDKSTLAIAEASLARQYGRLEQVDKQEEALRRSLQLYRELANPRNEAMVLADLGIVLSGKGEDKAARRCYLKAVELIVSKQLSLADFDSLGTLYDILRQGQDEATEELPPPPEDSLDGEKD
ncbi:tetratricopeptide repeat protein [Candidatus Fermentibacteria bacterium]|nr:tetratricopeptide repeat protein [Candidatus Fermentibacteria bacterium]